MATNSYKDKNCCKNDKSNLNNIINIIPSNSKPFTNTVINNNCGSFINNLDEINNVNKGIVYSRNISSNKISCNGNYKKGNYIKFKANPIKHWRKQLYPSQNYIINSRSSVKISTIEQPGGSIEYSDNNNSYLNKQKQFLYINKNLSLKQDISNCYYNKNKKNKNNSLSKNYNINYKSYLQSRVKLYEQNESIQYNTNDNNQYNSNFNIYQIQKKVLNNINSCNNNVVNNELNNKFICTENKTIIYKPNNQLFSIQGAASSKNYISYLKYNLNSDNYIKPLNFNSHGKIKGSETINTTNSNLECSSYSENSSYIQPSGGKGRHTRCFYTPTNKITGSSTSQKTCGRGSVCQVDCAKYNNCCNTLNSCSIIRKSGKIKCICFSTPEPQPEPEPEPEPETEVLKYPPWKGPPNLT